MKDAGDTEALLRALVFGSLRQLCCLLKEHHFMESLILAQSERWRRA